MKPPLINFRKIIEADASINSVMFDSLLAVATDNDIEKWWFEVNKTDYDIEALLNEYAEIIKLVKEVPSVSNRGLKIKDLKLLLFALNHYQAGFEEDVPFYEFARNVDGTYEEFLSFKELSDRFSYVFCSKNPDNQMRARLLYIWVSELSDELDIHPSKIYEQTRVRALDTHTQIYYNRRR